MNRFAKVLVACILVLSVAGVLLIYYYPVLLNFALSVPVRRSVRVDFPNSGSSLFLQSVSKGLNHTKRFISDDDDFDFDPKYDYVFNVDNDIFVIASSDTLKVYVMAPAPQPEVFDSKIVVQQIELDNPTFMELYQRTDLIRF